MPRPAGAAQFGRRATASTVTAPSHSASPCTCAPPAAHTSARTASTHAAPAPHAAPLEAQRAAAVPIEVLAPAGSGGFGFFSRSLPKQRRPSRARPAFVVEAPSSTTGIAPGPNPSRSWILQAPPQFPTDHLPTPSSSSSSTSPRPSEPLSPHVLLSAPPPPPPSPQPEPFDVRNWSPRPHTSLAKGAPVAVTPAPSTPITPRPICTSCSTSSTTSPFEPRTLVTSTRRVRLLPPHAAHAHHVPIAPCVCGRVQMTCLRCRASSSTSTAASQPQVARRSSAAGANEEGFSEGEEFGTEKNATSRDHAVAGADERSRRTRRQRSPAGQPDLPNDPSARLTALLRLYAPKSLPGIQGLTVVSTRPNRGSRRLSLAEARESLTSLRRELETDEAFFAALSVHEKLDLVRAVSTIARAVLPIAPDQVLPPLPGASADSTGSAAATGRIAEEQARIELRHGAAEYMRDLMRRGGLDALEAVGASPGSGTRSSAALLLLDAATLADEVVPLSQALHTAATSADARSGDGALLRAVRTLFRPLEPPAADDGAVDLVQASAREGTRRQNAHVALALILEALERSPHSDASDAYSSAPAALDSLFYLGAGELLEFVLPGASTTSRQRQVAFNDVLRRRYGVVLGRLEPTPARWFEREVDTEIADASAEEASRTRERLAALGLHLVRHLARAGSAGEAFSVWQTLVGVAPTAAAATSASAELRASPPKLVESLSDLERLEALALLVDGLALQRLYADANTLATELEDLARAVQIGGEGASEDASSPMAAEAYRALARLAAGQGRSPILDRVLSRLASLCEGSQGAATPTEGISLEAAARRMRARSRRYELDEVRAIFDEADLDRASPEERARLWGQLVAAYVRVNDVEGGLRALQDMLAAGLYVPATTINVVLHGFARRGDLQRAAELFGKLADGDFPRLQPDTTSWNALVLAHSVARDPSTIEGLIREMRLAGSQPTRQTWTTLLSAYVENGQFTAAFRVYRFLQMHPDPTMRPDTAVYNVMLKACILTSTPATTVVALFRDLIRRGVRPNMRTYTLVLQSVSIAGIMDVAEELYLLMDRRQDSPHRPPGMSVIEPDQFVFSTLVAGYLRRGDGPKARAMLEEMTRRGIRPSSVTVGILIAARIDLLQRRGGSISPAEMQRVIQQARDFLERGTNGEAGGLAARKRRQPVRFDRPLALGREATVVYAPILRSLAKQGDVGAALELFEEILDRQDSGRAPPVELYTTLMDAFRQQESEAAVPSASEGLAQNVYTIWGQLYDSVCDRFVRLRPVENAPALAPVGLPLPRFSRRVDPAQAGLLRLPLTILLDTASRLGDHALIESTWRRLIQQGFAFDTSNWNALASWFIRDLQLEKALWITEQVLCRAEALEEVESPERGAAFAAELAAGGGGVGNKPMTSRLWQARTLEAPASESRQVDLSFLHDEAEAPQAREGPHPEEPTETASSADVLESTSAPLESSSQEDGPEDGFTAAFPRRAILATLPYRRTLEALEAALDHLAVNASFRAEINSGAGSGTSGSGSGASSQRPPLVQLSLEAAQETYRRLVEAHPRTMQALKALRSRRRRAESERYERSKGRY